MQLAKHVKFREEVRRGPFRDPFWKSFHAQCHRCRRGAEIAAGHDQKEIAARLADRFSGPPAHRARSGRPDRRPAEGTGGGFGAWLVRKT